MATVELIAPADAPLTLRHLYEGGDPGPIVGALAQVPELCLATLPFVGASLGPSLVSLRLKEIAILRTSALLECRYCVDAHTVVAIDAGLADDELRVLRCELPRTEAFSDPAEAALIGWIDAVATGRGPVAPDVIAEVRTHFADHLLVELTTTITTTLMLNRFATSLGLPTSPETLQRLVEAGFSSENRP